MRRGVQVGRDRFLLEWVDELKVHLDSLFLILVNVFQIFVFVKSKKSLIFEIGVFGSWECSQIVFYS